MAHYPKCRDQFEDWAKKCPDCHVKTVGKLPKANKEQKNAQLVLLATTPNESIAVIWSEYSRIAASAVWLETPQ